MDNNQERFVSCSEICEIEKEQIKKIEIWFDLKTDKHKIKDTTYTKNIVCLNGSCTILLDKNNESFVLNETNKYIDIPKNIDVEIADITKDAKIFIAYCAD